jgi:flagellar biogenesis protein FliO
MAWMLESGGRMAKYTYGLISSPWEGGFLEIVFLLVVFCCVLFLAYIITRQVAKRASGRMKSRYMEVVDTLAVGAEAQLFIVKAGDEFFLISKSQKHLSMLTKLDITPGVLNAAPGKAQGFAENFRAVLESKLSRANIIRGAQRDDKERGGDSPAENHSAESKNNDE